MLAELDLTGGSEHPGRRIGGLLSDAGGTDIDPVTAASQLQCGEQSDDPGADDGDVLHEGSS